MVKSYSENVSSQANGDIRVCYLRLFFFLVWFWLYRTRTRGSILVSSYPRISPWLTERIHCLIGNTSSFFRINSKWQAGKWDLYKENLSATLEVSPILLQRVLKSPERNRSHNFGSILCCFHVLDSWPDESDWYTFGYYRYVLTSPLRIILTTEKQKALPTMRL